MNRTVVFAVIYTDKNRYAGMEGVFQSKKEAQAAINDIKELPECENLTFHIQKTDLITKEEI